MTVLSIAFALPEEEPALVRSRQAFLAARNEVDSLWEALHHNGVEWRPAVLRLFRAHDVLLKAASDLDWWISSRDQDWQCDHTVKIAQELVRVQRTDLALACGCLADTDPNAKGE